MKLHVGAGQAILPGWRNVDVYPYPGIDHVIDVTKGLPFENVDYIFAEHFLEHLGLTHALYFLEECRRVLKGNGILRISTPNLDWIWLTHYRHPDSLNDQEAVLGCLEMNRAFHGWGHKFIYNTETIRSALHSAGFESIQFQSYGGSTHPELSGLERHPKSEDLERFPHVLIVEASGIIANTESLRTIAQEYIRDLGVR